jgi:hypothetical protein
MKTMRVNAAAANGSGGFQITLRFINTPTAAQRAFFETAAAKWQGIIVGGRTQYYGDNPGPELREQFQDDEVIVHEMGTRPWHRNALELRPPAAAGHHCRPGEADPAARRRRVVPARLSLPHVL